MASIIYSTTSTKAEAEKIAHHIVEKKLVACVNILPQITSIYRWQETIEKETESLLIAKTSENNIDKAINTIKELHSYDVPDIIVIPITNGLQSYLDYVDKETL
jgi:periplasmic divalent cation tolerance protein